MSASDAVRKWIGYTIVLVAIVVAALYFLSEPTQADVPPIKSQRAKTQFILDQGK